MNALENSGIILAFGRAFGNPEPELIVGSARHRILGNCMGGMSCLDF